MLSFIFLRKRNDSAYIYKKVQDVDSGVVRSHVSLAYGNGEYHVLPEGNGPPENLEWRIMQDFIKSENVIDVGYRWCLDGVRFPWLRSSVCERSSENEVCQSVSNVRTPTNGMGIMLLHRLPLVAN